MVYFILYPLFSYSTFQPKFALALPPGNKGDRIEALSQCTELCTDWSQFVVNLYFFGNLIYLIKGFHTADADETKLSCLVLSPIVSTPPTRQFCLVSTQFR